MMLALVSSKIILVALYADVPVNETGVAGGVALARRKYCAVIHHQVMKISPAGMKCK